MRAVGFKTPIKAAATLLHHTWPEHSACLFCAVHMFLQELPRKRKTLEAKRAVVLEKPDKAAATLQHHPPGFAVQRSPRVVLQVQGSGWGSALLLLVTCTD